MDVLSKNQRLGRLQAALLLRDFASLSIINLNNNIFNTNNIVTSQTCKVPCHSARPGTPTVHTTTAQATETFFLPKFDPRF